jgi:hypothetical protein
MSRDIRSFDYVNHPYDRVRDALTANATEVFRMATHAARSRLESVASVLRVNIGAVEVSTAIDIEVGTIAEVPGGPGRPRMLEIPVRWKAAERAALFPVMNAQLDVYPLTSTETQLDFHGHYDPPLGVLGSAMDAAVGHRIAEASVHRFVTEVAQYLRAAK